jgi:hypothetical protein
MFESAQCTLCDKVFVRESSNRRKRLCLDCWRQKNGLSREAGSHSAGAAGIDTVMLRRLLQLCHPDRHGGSEASHTATQWLLTLRQRER